MESFKRSIAIILLGVILSASIVVTDVDNIVFAEKNDLDNLESIVDSHNNNYLRMNNGKVTGYNKRTSNDQVIDISKYLDKIQGKVVLPVDKKYFKTSSKFGVRKDPFKGNYGKDGKIESLPFHRGLDISAAGINGADIYSVLDGKIRKIDRGSSSYGNLVIIDHGGFETYYAHLQSFNKTIKEGDSVKAGDIIGKVGSTGRSTGPHLHIEFDFDSVVLNPELFISPETSIEIPKENKKEEEKKEEKNKSPETGEELLENSGIIGINNIITSSETIGNTGVYKADDGYRKIPVDIKSSSEIIKNIGINPNKRLQSNDGMNRLPVAR